MNLLAVNTSGFSASIAFCRFQISGSDNGHDEKQPETPQARFEFCYEHALKTAQSTAQFLVPAIDELVQSAGCNIGQIDRFAITTGPGSFTGLRIGLATVKTLAYATSAEVVGINSLAAIAQNSRTQGFWRAGRLATVINAFRRQFFIATFEYESFPVESLSADSQTRLIGHSELASEIIDPAKRVAGPGIEILNSSEREKIGSSIVDAHLNDTARGVAELAATIRHPREDPMSISPHYFRGSAAEEKLPRQ